jgi:hypothetical protein
VIKFDVISVMRLFFEILAGLDEFYLDIFWWDRFFFSFFEFRKKKGL